MATYRLFELVLRGSKLFTTYLIWSTTEENAKNCTLRQADSLQKAISAMKVYAGYEPTDFVPYYFESIRDTGKTTYGFDDDQLPNCAYPISEKPIGNAYHVTVSIGPCWCVYLASGVTADDAEKQVLEFHNSGVLEHRRPYTVARIERAENFEPPYKPELVDSGSEASEQEKAAYKCGSDCAWSSMEQAWPEKLQKMDANTPLQQGDYDYLVGQVGRFSGNLHKAFVAGWNDAIDSKGGKLWQE